MSIRCCNCGRFISYQEADEGRAKFYFEPDSHRGPEIEEWTCGECAAPAADREKQP